MLSLIRWLRLFHSLKGSSRAEKNRVKRPRNAILDENYDLGVSSLDTVDTDVSSASVSAVLD